MGKIALFLILLLFAQTAHSATKLPRWARGNYLSAQWQGAIPVANTYAVTPRLSLKGVSLGYRFRINDRFSVGPRWGFQQFEDTETTPFGNTTLETRAMFLTADLHYYFAIKNTLLPFLGAGIGAMGVYHTRNLPGPGDEAEQWHPALSTEIGMVSLLKRIPLLMGAAFFLAPPTPDTHWEAFASFYLGIVIPN